MLKIFYIIYAREETEIMNYKNLIFINLFVIYFYLFLYCHLLLENIDIMRIMKNLIIIQNYTLIE